MGIGAGGGELHEINVRATFTDQLTGPLARSRSEVDAYVSSLERLVAAQSRAGVAGGLTVGGASVAQSGPFARGSAAVSSSGIGAGAGGPGRPPPTVNAGPGIAPGAVSVGGFVPPPAGGSGGRGRPAGVVPGLGGAGAGGGRPGSNQNTALRFAVTGLRDLEAASGALGGILQSVTSLRTLTTAGAAGAIIGVPLGLANQAERAQRALQAVTGSLQTGAQLAQQIQQTALNAPYDLSQTRGIGVALSRVSGGQFASRAPAQTAAIADLGTAMALDPQQMAQVGGIFAAAQSMQTRRRMSADMLNQLEDLGVPDVYGAIAAARGQAHPGEQWTAQSLRAYMMGGGSLPGVETTQELSRLFEQRYKAQADQARRTAPDVQAGLARNRVTDLTTQWGTNVQAALSPAIGAAAEGNWGAAAAGLAPWNLAGGNLAGGLAIGAVETVLAANAVDMLARGPFRAMRPITRLGRAAGVLPRGGGPGAVARAGTSVMGVTGAAAAGGVPAAAARQYAHTVAQVTRQGGSLENAQAIARASVASAYGPEAAAALERSGVPLEAARQAVANRSVGLYRQAASLPAEARAAMVQSRLSAQFGAETLGELAGARGGGPGRPPNLPPAGGAAVGIEEAAARDIGVLGRAGGALGRVGRGLGRVAPWLGLSLGLFGAYEAARAGQEQDALRQAGGSVGGAAGGWGGAVAGAALGTAILPGVGTVAGGVIGALGGGVGGGWIGEQLGGALGGAAGLHDQQRTANEEALRQTQQGTESDRQLTDETVQLTRAFTDLEHVVRSLTQDYINQRRRGGGSNSPGFPGAGGGGLNPTPPVILGPGVNGQILPGNPNATPQPGDVAGWKAWLQPFIPPELANDPNFLSTVVAGAKAESGLDPNRDQVGGGGRGLFQFDVHGGMGTGLSLQQLHDPAYQAERMVPRYVQAWKNAPPGLTGAEKASWVAGMAELPQDYTNPNSAARRSYAAAYGQVAPVPVAAAADAAAPVSPDINASGGGGSNITVQMGDINVPVTLGGVPADRAGQRQWARNVTDYLAEELANSLSASEAGTAVSTTAVPQAFGG